MKKIKRCISISTQVLLTLSIILVVLCIFVRYIVFDKNTYIKILNENNVYARITDLVYEKIDDTLKSKNINYDVKEDIITEDDIKREADSAISGTIEYLETGENNIKPIDAEVYKQRASAILHSVMDNIVKTDKESLSFNNQLNIENTSYVMGNQKVSEMNVFGQGKYKIEKLMSKEEAEARVREILKEKGMTEEQAIKKAREKGITEDQALKILDGYGITIDGLSDGDSSKKQEEGTVKKDDNKRNSSSQSSADVQSNNDVQGNDNKATSNIQGGSHQSSVTNKTAKEQLAELENKLMQEADSSIEKEIEKVDINETLEISRFTELTKVTAILYKSFWLIIILPFIIMSILLVNGRGEKHFLKKIGGAFLSAGLIMSIVFSFGYISKVYEKINVAPDYFKEIVSYVIRYFFEILLTFGIGTFIIGLLLIITTIIMSKSKVKSC